MMKGGRGHQKHQPAKPPAQIGAGARFSLGFLAAVCLLLGTLPTYIFPVLNRSVEPLAGASVTTSLVQPFFTAKCRKRAASIGISPGLP
jgi:hypothetical protein